MAHRIAALLNTVDAPPLRIALAAGSPLIRAGLQAGLAAFGDLEIVGLRPSLRVLQQEGYAGAEVVIAELGSPADAAWLADHADEGPALVLLCPAGSVAPADWLALGCSVLEDDASIERIAAAARAAAAGLAATSPALAAQLQRLPAAAAGELETLTPREHEVLQQMSLGKGNREIAADLHISAHTAKFHVAQIIAKLDASSRAHAVAKALRAGLIEL